MSKRGNENAQLSKEEYEAQESRGNRGSDGLTQGFDRASEDLLNQRRIIKAHRSVTVRTPGGSTHPTKDAPSSSNPFANVNFSAAAPATTTTNWFTKTSSSSTPAPAAVAAATRPPVTPFVFSSKPALEEETPDNNDADTNSAKRAKPNHATPIAFGAATSATAGSGTTNNSNTSSSTPGIFSFLGNSGTSTTPPATAAGFSFGSNTANNSSNTSNTLAPAPFAFTMTTTTTPAATVAGSATNTTSTSTTTSGPKLAEVNAQFARNVVRLNESLQQSMEGYQAGTVDVSVRLCEYLDLSAFMEGDYAQQRKAIEAASVNGPTSNKTGFTFGATPAAVAAAPSTTTTTPGSSASSFWASPPVATSATPAAAAAAAATTVAVDETSEPSDNPMAESANAKSPPLARADVDWTDLHILDDVHIFHYRSNKNLTKFCAGNLKLQVHDADTTSRRMILRNDWGKVEFNVKLDPSISYIGGVQMKKNGQGVEFLMFMGANSQEFGCEKFAIKRRKPADVITGHEPATSMEAIARSAAGISP